MSSLESKSRKTDRIIHPIIGLAGLSCLLFGFCSPCPACQNETPETKTTSNQVSESDPTESKDPTANATPEKQLDAQVDNDPLGLRTLPEQAVGVGVNSQEGTFIDKELTFYDSENRLVRLGDLFTSGKKPVMLSFNYSSCPKLCSVQLENITMALREVDLQVGKDFDYLSLSIDPKETTQTAKKTKDLYTGYYNRKESNSGWHFWVGKKENIEKLAGQCGFMYKYLPDQKEYSHVPAIILISPEGEIVRYIAGLDYQPKTIRLALIETAEGKIGSPVDWAAYSLGCYSFDASMGKYSFQMMFLMRIGGLITVVLLLATLIPYWFFRRNQPEKLLENPTVGSTI